MITTPLRIIIAYVTFYLASITPLLKSVINGDLIGAFVKLVLGWLAGHELMGEGIGTVVIVQHFCFVQSVVQYPKLVNTSIEKPSHSVYASQIPGNQRRGLGSDRCF